MEWSEDAIVQLKGLWAEGHSTAEIGRRLGISKNAVVGKAHRLNLPARPSPIHRGGSGGNSPAQRTTSRPIAGPTLPPLSSTVPSLPVQAPVVVVAPKPPPAPRPHVQAVPAPPRPYGRVMTCCWPIGEPGTPGFRFCDAESVPGKPYCTCHAQLAYVKIRDKREDAA